MKIRMMDVRVPACVSQIGGIFRGLTAAAAAAKQEPLIAVR